MEISVKDAPDRSRYELEVDGEHGGYAEYRRRESSVVFLHTEVDERYEGHGVGSELVREALDDVRAAGLGVVPRCPFVAAWIERHPDYRELVVEPS